MRCTKHPEHDAEGMCSYSGKPYCADELVEMSGRMYAKDNLDKVFAEMKEQAGKSAAPNIFMNAGGGGGGSSSSSSAAAAAVGGGYGARRHGTRSRGTAIVLAALLFLGLGGLHRIYTGHLLIGLLQLLTLGGFFVWQIIDIIAISSGSYRDAQGELLLR